MRKIIKVKKALPIKGITSGNDLHKLAKRLGVRVDAITTASEAHKLPARGSFIILLQGSSGGVGHWVARYNDQYFDSTGEGPPSSIPHINEFNDAQYQSTYDDYCGGWCLLWLLSKQKKDPSLMNHFYDLDWN